MDGYGWPAPGWQVPELLTFPEDADAGRKTALGLTEAHLAPHGGLGGKPSSNPSRVSSPLLLHTHPGAASRRAAAEQPGVALEGEEPEELLFFLPSLSGSG